MNVIDLLQRIDRVATAELYPHRADGMSFLISKKSYFSRSLETTYSGTLRPQVLQIMGLLRPTSMLHEPLQTGQPPL